MDNFDLVCEQGDELRLQEKYEEAMELYSKGAKANHPRCTFKVGSMYMEGHGVGQDYTNAYQWFRKAADLKEPKAFMNLGLMHSNSDYLPIKQDIQLAMDWYQRGVDIGYTPCFNELARMYVMNADEIYKEKTQSEAIASGMAEAKRLYQMSAKFGNSDGYFGLAMLSIHEVGYPTPEIADYFEKASSLGHVGANEHLAKFYFMQLRCVKDSSERSELFQKIRFSLERGAAAVSPDNQYNIENYPSFENLYCMSTLSSLYLTRNPITGEKNIDAAATLLKRMYQKYPKETRELLSQLEQKHHDDIALIYKTIGI